MKTHLSKTIASFVLVLTAACGSSGNDGGGNGGNGNGGSGADAGIGGGSINGQGTPVLNGGLGKVCAEGTECAAGLACRTDTDEWISHHQCTTSCKADADCTAKFGSHTMCIGANICVSKCLDDKDCPASTRCSENGWCANDGPGSGVPKCSGIPSSCASLTAAECGSTLGCTAGGTCGGSGELCSTKDEFSCGSTSGCYWDSSARFCSGVTSPCSSNSSQYACQDQTGCYWTPSCTGTQSATSCASQGATLCKYTAGCSLVPQ